CPPIGEGLMQALWVGAQLLLVRRVAVNGADYVQGCLLNWSGIANRLLEGSRDLLPDAQLLPAGTEPESQPWLRLQALPARLAPGQPGDDPFPLTSPIRVSLAVAWTCALLAVIAVGAL